MSNVHVDAVHEMLKHLGGTQCGRRGKVSGYDFDRLVSSSNGARKSHIAVTPSGVTAGKPSCLSDALLPDLATVATTKVAAKTAFIDLLKTKSLVTLNDVADIISRYP